MFVVNFAPKDLGNKGFAMEFENGNFVSVMFGKTNYCQHKMKNCEVVPAMQEFPEYKWKSSDVFITNDKEEKEIGPFGWESPESIARLMFLASSKSIDEIKNGLSE